MLCLANDSVMSIMMSLWVKIDREVQGYYWKTFSSRNFFIFTASNNSTITQPFSHTFIARQSWPRNKENGFSHSQSLVVSFAADSPFLFIIILRHVYDMFTTYLTWFTKVLKVTVNSIFIACHCQAPRWKNDAFFRKANIHFLVSLCSTR